MQYWRKIKFPQIHFPTGPLKLALRLSCLLKTQKRTHPRIRFSFTWNIWGITLLWRNKIEFKYQCGTSGIVISTFYFLFVFQWFCLSFLLSFCFIILVSLLRISGLQSVFSHQGILLSEKRPFPLFLGTKDQHKTLNTEFFRQRAAKASTRAHVNKRWYFLSGWKTWWDAIYFTGIILCSNPAIRRLNGAALNVHLKKKMPTPFSLIRPFKNYVKSQTKLSCMAGPKTLTLLTLSSLIT